ncbi:MAG: MFS transporter [Leptolyngbyaceae cyanobacterium SL_1_1]|nr:MFS transporter [Leptolyngbyaceae cyanobacterium RM1_1_2]NJO10940.1 MFS transporter [Leptolyngbyaceae cyanobacterium SL_1_1]
MIGFNGMLTAWHFIAQLSDAGVDTPEEAALVFSGPQFFVALLSGLILAFGFQMLLTNLSVAAGVSYLAHSGSGKSSSDDSGTSIQTISVAFGLWTLITVSIALFFACWLAVKLSLFDSWVLGTITGLVIWGLYFTLLVWISSTTVGSLIGSVVKQATASFQAVVGTATAAMSAKATSNQLVATAEAAAAAVRREFTEGVDAEAVKDTLQDYIATLRSPEVDVTDLEQEFERIVSDSDLQGLGDSEALRRVDRQVFVDLVSSRSDLSPREVNRIADRLYKSWQRSLSQSSSSSGIGELVDYLRSAHPEEISQGLNQRLDQLLQELRLRRQGQGQDQASSDSGPIKQVLSQGLNTVMGIAMGRTDLSDLDVEKILSQIRSTRDQLTDQAQKVASQVGDEQAEPVSLLKSDVENYLLNTYVWQMRGDRLAETFRNVLYDPDADPATLRRQIEQLNRSYFADVLKSRGLLTQAEIQKTSLQLETVRQQVFREVQMAEWALAQKELRREAEIFLQLTPKEELLTDMGDRAFEAIVEDSEATSEQLRERYTLLSSNFMVQVLTTRPDLDEGEIQHIVSKFQQTLNRKVGDAEGVQQAAKARLDNQWQQVQDYLRNTGKAELNPEGIKRDLQTLLDEPETGIRQLRGRLSHFDRDTLVQLLSQRPDISEADVDQIVSQVEGNWYQLMSAPQQLSTQVQEKYHQATTAIADYLRGTGKTELNPEGIQRDLQKLLDDPKVGAKAIQARLARMDRDTLVQLLSQRDDLSEAEVNQVIDQILDSIRNLLRSPRRLARRAQEQIQSFEAALENYLLSTDKAELHPEGIKRDLQILLEDPRLGAEKIGDRLSRMDRDTLVALLAQRQDLSREEASEIVARVETVRDRIQAQIKMVQHRIESVIDSILSRIRRYLNSLDRPELNYEGVQRDIRKLFNDPQAGFSALGDRLSQFDRNTLVAIVSSHDSISQSDANRVIDQIEAARESVLRRAQRIETQIEARLQALKQQAHDQLEATKKSAEAAAWWLFGTALVSAIVSGVAGGIAVIN